MAAQPRITTSLLFPCLTAMMFGPMSSRKLKEEAKAEGIDIQVSKFNWAASGRASAVQRNDGLTKLIVDPQSKRILGVGMVGLGVGEMIAEGVLAIEMAAQASDLALSIHPHPTLSETIMEAAELIYGNATHAFKR